MRTSGPDNVVTYEVVDKRRGSRDRLVSAFGTERAALDALKKIAAAKVGLSR